jgi:hypothetical protein
MKELQIDRWEVLFTLFFFLLMIDITAQCSSGALKVRRLSKNVKGSINTIQYKEFYSLGYAGLVTSAPASTTVGNTTTATTVGVIDAIPLEEEMPFQACLQVAINECNGMQYLERSGFIHHDLAARNVLLSTKMVAKFGDFEFAKALNPKEDYYYFSSAGSKLPTRWSAPESVSHGKFSSKTDVWAFGITLFEIFSMGKIPYEGVGI